MLLEDVAALTGLAFALRRRRADDPHRRPDLGCDRHRRDRRAAGGGRVILGIETKSLLVGEGANRGDIDKIRDAFNASTRVEALIHMKTLYLGPDELLVAAKVAFPKTTRVADVARAINEVEAEIRAAVPVARVIYIEPDIYLPPTRSHRRPTRS